MDPRGVIPEASCKGAILAKPQVHEQTRGPEKCVQVTRWLRVVRGAFRCWGEDAAGADCLLWSIY